MEAERLPPSSLPPPRGVAVEAYRRLRQDVSQGLHDTLCQTLGGAELMVRVLTGRLQDGESLKPADLERFRIVLERARHETQVLGGRFQPLARRPDALMETLRQLAAATAEKTPCEFRCREPVLVSHSESAHTLCLIAHEAVGNALRHAGATRLEIALLEREGRITLEIADNGRGCVAAVAGEGLGVGMMRWHAAQIGAELTIGGAPGTTVRCVLKP